MPVSDLMPATLFKMRLRHWCIFVNFAKFLRTLFYRTAEVVSSVMSNLYSHAIKFAFPVASLVSRKLIGEEKQDNLKSFIFFFQCDIKVISVF